MNDKIDDQQLSKELQVLDNQTICPQCQREFRNKIALKMHIGRVHTHAIDPNRRSKTKEERRQYKIEYGRKWRARRRAAKGLPPVTPGKEYRWSDEQHAKYRRTMRRKRRLEAIGNIKVARTSRRNRILHVYPDPNKETAALPIPMKYCPSCGEHLAGWAKSI